VVVASLLEVAFSFVPSVHSSARAWVLRVLGSGPANSNSPGELTIFSLARPTPPAPRPAALGGSLSVLRTFRLARVFKLGRSWKELNRIINVLGRSVTSVGWLSVLLLLVVFVFALMGMQLFGFRLQRCELPGAAQLCPPGRAHGVDCPPHPDCFVACGAEQAGTWFDAPGGLCECGGAWVGGPMSMGAGCKQRRACPAWRWPAVQLPPPSPAP
jgi:hypothetical protein